MPYYVSSLPKTISLLGYPEVIPYSKPEHFGIIGFWIWNHSFLSCAPDKQRNRQTRTSYLRRPSEFVWLCCGCVARDSCDWEGAAWSASVWSACWTAIRPSAQVHQTTPRFYTMLLIITNNRMFSHRVCFICVLSDFYVTILNVFSRLIC